MRRAVSVPCFSDQSEDHLTFVPRHAHGGFTTSLIFSTVRTYFLSKYPATPQPDPISSNVHFVQPAPRGRVVLTVTELSHGKRYSTVEVKLRNPAGEICTTATVIQGNLAAEYGPSIEVPPVMAAHEIPNRERDCDETQYPPLLLRLMPVSAKMRVLKRKEGKTQVWSRKGKDALNVKETWMQWQDPNQKLDVISLGNVCDTVSIDISLAQRWFARLFNKQTWQFLPAPLNFDPAMSDLSKYVFPTLCMSIEIKKDPKNAEWLFTEIVCHKIHNGRWDTDVRVLDEQGELVALSKHVSVMAEMTRTKASKITVGDEFAKL